MEIIFKLFRLFKRKFDDFYWNYIDFFWKRKSFKTDGFATNKIFSLGIVTYIARFEENFIPLLKQISHLFSDTEIIVAVNGYYDNESQQEYLKKVDILLKDFPNIKCIKHEKPQSLSKLWNEIIKNSSCPKTLIFNDDLNLNSKFRVNLSNSGLVLKNIAIINNSWSHFLISKHIINKIGWFDERYFGIGFEDYDYETRLARDGVAISNVMIKGVKNIIAMTNDFSYAKTMEVTNNKYSKDNQLFFYKKWQVSKNYKPGYVWVRILNGYAKLNEGMETPDYGPKSKLGAMNVKL